MHTAYPSTRISPLRAADRRSGPRALCLMQPAPYEPANAWAQDAMVRASLGESAAAPGPARTRGRLFALLAITSSACSGLSREPLHQRRWLEMRRQAPQGLSFRLDILALDDLAPCLDATLEIPLTEQRWLLELFTRGDRLTHFQRLGVPPTTEPSTIRRGYLRVAQRLHPDRYYGKHIGRFAAVLVDLFHRAHAAQAYLADPHRCRRYLGQLAAAGHPVAEVALQNPPA